MIIDILVFFSDGRIVSLKNSSMQELNLFDIEEIRITYSEGKTIRIYGKHKTLTDIPEKDIQPQWPNDPDINKLLKSPVTPLEPWRNPDPGYPFDTDKKIGEYDWTYQPNCIGKQKHWCEDVLVDSSHTCIYCFDKKPDYIPGPRTKNKADNILPDFPESSEKLLALQRQRTDERLEKLSPIPDSIKQYMDDLYEKMQTPEAKAAVDKLFDTKEILKRQRERNKDE